MDLGRAIATATGHKTSEANWHHLQSLTKWQVPKQEDTFMQRSVEGQTDRLLPDRNPNMRSVSASYDDAWPSSKMRAAEQNERHEHNMSQAQKIDERSDTEEAGIVRSSVRQFERRSMEEQELLHATSRKSWLSRQASVEKRQSFTEPIHENKIKAVSDLPSHSHQEHAEPIRGDDSSMPAEELGADDTDLEKEEKQNHTPLSTAVSLEERAADILSQTQELESLEESQLKQKLAPGFSQNQITDAQDESSGEEESYDKFDVDNSRMNMLKKLDMPGRLKEKWSGVSASSSEPETRRLAESTETSRVWRF